MKALLEQIRRAVVREGLSWETDGSSVLVRFKTGRQQRVTVSLEGGAYLLESVVLARRDRPEGLGSRELMMRAWLRNAHTQIVAFGMDRREKLVGRVRVPVNSIHRHARTYIELLAIECDRFEYVLTGTDVTT
jgi:hypothetical protein